MVRTAVGLGDQDVASIGNVFWMEIAGHGQLHGIVIGSVF
jgi:hypothetical protein